MILLRYSWLCGRDPSALGRELVRSVLGRVKIFAPTPDDKPRILGGPDFSIAHAGKLVVAAIALDPDLEVGIDVEQVDPRRRVDEIAEAALDDESAEELRQLPPDQRVERFTTWWVRIEAVAKATGAGLTLPIDPTPPPLAYRDLAMPTGYRAALAWSYR